MAARKRSQLRRKISHRALGLPPAGLCAQPVRARPGLILRTSLILRTIRDPTSLIRALRLRSTDSRLSLGAAHQELVRTPPPRAVISPRILQRLLELTHHSGGHHKSREHPSAALLIRWIWGCCVRR